MIQVKFKKLSDFARTPQRMSVHASGYDIYSAIRENIVIPAGGRASVPTALAISLPQGYEAQIRPRSGLALKHGIGILNSPGTVDADYRGEILVILYNAGKEDFIVMPGMRIAQMVVMQIPEIELVETNELDETARNSGGFGHTGH